MKIMIKHLLTAVLSISLSALILSTSVLIILNFKSIYYTFLESGKINNMFHLTREEIKENYDSLIAYNGGFGEKTLNLPHLPSSEAGLIHFKEVRAIFIGLKIVLLLSLIILLTALVLFKTVINPNFLLYGGVLNLLSVSFLSLLMFFDFSNVFEAFHHIAFDNDLWIFDYKKDPIILYLPEDFFMVAALSIAGAVVFLSLLSVFVRFLLQKKHTPSE